jgi:hypothetical protein
LLGIRSYDAPVEPLAACTWFYYNENGIASANITDPCVTILGADENGTQWGGKLELTVLSNNEFRKVWTTENAPGANIPISSGTGDLFLSDDGLYKEVPTTWGKITGTLSNQTDLQDALNAKLNLSGGTLTGNLTMNVNSANANISIKPSDDTGATQVILKNSSDVVKGSFKNDNVSGNLRVIKYNDSGSETGYLEIKDNGNIAVSTSANPTEENDLCTKKYIDDILNPSVESQSGTDYFKLTADQDTFTTSVPFNPAIDNVNVMLNGVVLFNTDYTLTAPNQVIFNETAVTGDEVIIQVFSGEVESAYVRPGTLGSEPKPMVITNCTQAEYDSITPDPNTIYFIVEP